MPKLQNIIQIMPAEHYWKVYKHSTEEVCYYRKVYFFMLIDTHEGPHNYQSVFAIDWEEDFDCLNVTDQMENFICLRYDPDLHESICDVCFKLYVNCKCEEKNIKISRNNHFDKQMVKWHEIRLQENADLMEAYKQKNLNNVK